MSTLVSPEGEKSQRLAVAGREIHVLFDSILRSQLENRLAGYSAAAWEHEYQRFYLWANSFGLHYRGHSSLDYRLRESETLIGLFATLILSLKTSLHDGRLSISFCPHLLKRMIKMQPIIVGL